MHRDLKVCLEKELTNEKPHRFEIFDPETETFYKLVVIKDEEKIYVLNDTCTHANFPLSKGEFDQVDLTIECQKHGALFSVLDGEPLCLPATKPVKVYDSFIENGIVMVRLDDE